MTLAVLAGVAVLLVMNSISRLGIMPSKYLSPNDVQGMAVEHNGKLYTLNFEQQNQLVNILNRSIPVGEELVEKRKIQVDHTPEIKKIIIYRFKAPTLELIPVAYVSKSTSIMQSDSKDKVSMVYSVPEWDQHGLFEESTSDELNKLLFSTYGP